MISFSVCKRSFRRVCTVELFWCLQYMSRHHGRLQFLFFQTVLRKGRVAKKSKWVKKRKKKILILSMRSCSKKPLLLYAVLKTKESAASFLTEVSNWLGDTIFFFTHQLASIKVNSYGSRDLLSFPFLLIFLFFYAAKRSVDYSVLIG